MSREGCEKPKGPGEPGDHCVADAQRELLRRRKWSPSPCCEQVSQGRPGKCELYLATPFESDSREELEQEWVCWREASYRGLTCHEMCTVPVT